MPERPYFDESGEPSDAPGRFVHVDDLDALTVGQGLEFRPVTTDTVMTNFVSFEPNVPAPMHHHVEQQIAVVLSGELTLTVGDETKVMRAGDCVVIPPNVRHGGAAGPEGCEVLDVFSPPRAAIVSLMATRADQALGNRTLNATSEPSWRVDGSVAYDSVVEDGESRWRSD